MRFLVLIQKQQEFSLVVMKDSDYQEVSDLKNQTIEANLDDEDNAKYMNEAIEALNKEESTIQVIMYQVM